MTTSYISSQSITKDSVTTSKETFKQIVKDLRKCDSLQVAYSLQSQSFNDLIEANNKMFRDFETERTKKNSLKLELQEKEATIKKLFQKPNNGWFVPSLVGIVIGLVLGVSL